METSRPSFVCNCGHRTGRHFNTKARPNGPCRDCGCTAFTPELLCVCGHGKKAHDTKRGHCKEAYKCGCKAYRATA